MYNCTINNNIITKRIGNLESMTYKIKVRCPILTMFPPYSWHRHVVCCLAKFMDLNLSIKNFFLGYC